MRVDAGQARSEGGLMARTRRGSPLARARLPRIVAFALSAILAVAATVIDAGIASPVAEAASARPRAANAPSCSPRPRVLVKSEWALLPAFVGLPGVDAIHVTVSATGANNTLRAIRFTSLSNAAVNDVDGTVRDRPFVLTFPADWNLTRYAFPLWRLQAPSASTARLVVVDGCGEWPTFVGRGRG